MIKESMANGVICIFLISAKLHKLNQMNLYFSPNFNGFMPVRYENCFSETIGKLY